MESHTCTAVAVLSSKIDAYFPIRDTGRSGNLDVDLDSSGQLPL
jgi:hypothetical protein